jgi:putative DNA primase/helicase
MPWTYADFLAVLDQTPLFVDEAGPAGPSIDAATDPAAFAGQTGIVRSAGAPDYEEADDDPHRLARINLEHYATDSDGRTLRYWRDEWYTWKRNAYRKISERELRMKIAQAVREEFVRINVAKREAVESDGKDPGPVQKVTLAIVSNVIQATGGQVCVSSDVEPNTWLPDRSRRHYVSMTNGIIDIDAVLADRDDYLLPNTPQWWSMVSLPYEFDPEARCTLWDKFLEYNLEMDPERIKVLQEWAGYLLLASTDEQKFMVLEGEGKNGKSVYIAGLTAMLGEENVSTVALENFGDRFQLTTTIGKLLNAAGDCGDLDKAAEGILKSFTSGDRMHFDRKGIVGLTCAPTARLMIACNNRPRFADRSDGVYRRMLVIPWNVEIGKEKRIKGMDKVGWWQRSGELPGIFRWALVGLARLKAQGGFTDSVLMNEALDEYKEEMNPARSFLKQNMEAAETGLVKSAMVYRIYKRWIDENGYRPLSERQFGKEVKRAFRKSTHVKRGNREERFWAYEGIQFSQELVAGEDTSEAKLF